MAKTARQGSISLYPQEWIWVKERAAKAGITVSQYFRALAKLDAQKNILANALIVGLKD